MFVNTKERKPHAPLLNRLTQVTDPTGTYSFTYDNLGRLMSTDTQYSFMSAALNNSYIYDAASNRTSLYPPGEPMSSLNISRPILSSQR